MVYAKSIPFLSKKILSNILLQRLAFFCLRVLFAISSTIKLVPTNTNINIPNPTALPTIAPRADPPKYVTPTIVPAMLPAIPPIVKPKTSLPKFLLREKRNFSKTIVKPPNIPPATSPIEPPATTPTATGSVAPAPIIAPPYKTNWQTEYRKIFHYYIKVHFFTFL